MKKFVLVLGLVVWGVGVRGQVTFQKAYGGLLGDGGYGLSLASNGGYVFCGYTLSFDSGFYVFKINNIGDTVWTRTFGGSYLPDGGAYTIGQISDGGYIVAGSNSNGSSGNVPFIVKLDSNGNKIWENRSQLYNLSISAGQNSAAEWADHSLITVGRSYLFGPSEAAHLYRTNSSGVIQWAKLITFPFCTGYDVVTVSPSTSVSTGTMLIQLSSGNNYGFYMQKNDTAGNVIWTKTYDGTGYDVSMSVKATTDNGYIMCGYTNSFGAGNFDILVIKTNSTGDTLWTNTYGGAGNDYGYSIKQVNDGYIITGYTNSFGAGLYDVYLIKIDNYGTPLWSKTFGGASNDYGYTVERTNDGYIICGVTYSFGSGQSDIYVIKTDSMGNSGCNQNTVTTLMNSGSISVSIPTLTVSDGYTNISPANYTQQYNSGCSLFTQCEAIGIDEIQNINTFILYPNPTTSSFTISFNEESPGRELEITDVAGRVVYQQAVNHNSEIIHQNFSAGVYFVRVRSGERVSTQKLIIQ